MLKHLVSIYSLTTHVYFVINNCSRRKALRRRSRSRHNCLAQRYDYSGDIYQVGSLVGNTILAGRRPRECAYIASHYNINGYCFLIEHQRILLVMVTATQRNLGQNGPSVGSVGSVRRQCSSHNLELNVFERQIWLYDAPLRALARGYPLRRSELRDLEVSKKCCPGQPRRIDCITATQECYRSRRNFPELWNIL